MRKSRAFRPWMSEILESRVVPATAGVLTSTGIPGISVILPSQVATASPQVQAAFVAFDRSYIAAVDNVLLAAGPNGVVVPSSNRAAFDAAIEESLETLAGQLVLSLDSSTTSATTTTAANAVVDAIVGTGSNSLESQLLALQTSAIGVTSPLITSVASPSTQAPVANVVSTAEVVRATNRIPDADGTGTIASPTTTSPSSSSTASDDIRSAFGNFLNDYFKAVQGVLLAPDATGQVNPQAHRVAFEARVDQALQALDTRLGSVVSRYPATSTLAAQIQSTIEGQGAASLKTQLAGIATPETSQAAAVREFTLGSTRAIAGVLSLINGDVSKLLNPAGN